MINIVVGVFPQGVKERVGYSYRWINMEDNPSIIASDLENLDEDLQLDMFKRIDKENANLYVFGGDCDSLLREIFIKGIIDDKGCILATSFHKPMVASYKDCRFDYMVTYDDETE